MKKLTMILLSFFMFLSCNIKENQNAEKLKNNKPKSNLKKNKVSKSLQSVIISKTESDTIVIQNLTAIIYNPTNKAIEKRKKGIGEEDFYIGVNGCW